MSYLKLLSIFIGVIFVALLLPGASPAATPEAAPQATPTIPPTATVVDTKGKSYNVADLKAKYTVQGGNWFPGPPKRITESLDIVLELEEDRVAITEELKIPFASMRRVVFKEASVPEKFKEVFNKKKPIRIEMRDDSVVLLSDDLLVKIDAKGNQTRAVNIRKYLFVADPTSGGAEILLNGFSGRAKTASGKEGDFWVPLSETQSIEFK